MIVFLDIYETKRRRSREFREKYDIWLNIMCIRYFSNVYRFYVKKRGRIRKLPKEEFLI